jgi:hypothetical protein
MSLKGERITVNGKLLLDVKCRRQWYHNRRIVYLASPRRNVDLLM